MRYTLRRIFFGSPLPTWAKERERLTKAKALAVFSSDALSSVAYATEEILLVLILAGRQALGLSLPVALAITGLLLIVGTSYYQTIHGYPSGGGAYIVAYENLGVRPGLVAAASLLTDYVLTVAVSITAGVVAITSAFPTLLPFRVELGLLVLMVITWGNLLGVRESGTLFSIPTYGFILIFLSLILVGAARAAAGTLSPLPGPAEADAVAGAHPLTVLLILRAFASGCTALTGIEAISNGIPAFRKPEADNAGKTLIAMIALLMTMFIGITLLGRWLGVAPVERESIVSQIGRQVFGDGPPYLILQAFTAMILALAANTSFADFPRLASILARDGYLPRQLTNLGDRLVFSNGILALAVLASLLIVMSNGQTHKLIPLYAVGVFLSFTLSQAGMVRHWQKKGGRHRRLKAAINGLGAMTTAAVLLVIVESKFSHGAWIIVLLVPTLLWGFQKIKRYYVRIMEQLSLERGHLEPWPGLATARRHKVVVPIAALHRGTLAALRFARTMSRDVTAVIVDVDPEATARVRDRWSSLGTDVPLVVLESPYRSVIRPLLAYLDEADRRDPERGSAVVVLPELVPPRWWQNLLHNQTALLFKAVLLYRRRGRPGAARVIIDVPYFVEA